MRILILMIREAKYILFIFIICAFTDARAQNADSLLKEFDTNGSSSGKIAVANRFFVLLNEEQFTDELIKFNSKSNQDSVKMYLWYWAGEYLYDRQKYDMAISYALRALSLCKAGKNQIIQSDCENLLAILYFRKADYTHALSYAKQSLVANRKIGDKSRISSTLNTIAGICLAAKEPKEGEKYILEAIVNSESVRDSNRVAIQYGMASEIYHSLGEDNKALSYAQKAYNIDTGMGNKGKSAIRLSQMATAQISIGKTGEAEKSLLKAIPILKEVGNMQSLGICYNQMGALLNKRGDYRQAERYFRGALVILTERKDLYNESKARYGLYEALKATNQAEAIQHLQRYTDIKDTLYHHNLEEMLSRYNAKYKNEELIVQNEREQAHARVVLVIAALIVVILISLLAFLLYAFRSRRRRYILQDEMQKTKDLFFTNITHEFRTPLTIIQSAAQDIMKKAGKEETIHRDVTDIMVHGQNLLGLINQILDIAKMTSGMARPEWKHGDIVGFISMMCESYDAYAAGKGIRIVFTVREKSVEMDFIPDYVYKIVHNLISNAIKFSNSGGTVQLSVQKRGESLQINVRDEGIGMTEEQQHNIFKPFYQVQGNGRSIGTGIGLPLTKLAVDAMGGSIKVHTSPDHGTSFIVEIPLKNNVSERFKPEEALGLAMQQVKFVDNACQLQDDDKDGIEDAEESVRVLIVEDAGEVARYIGLQLNPSYHFYYASDGNEGLNKAMQLVPDLIITDIMMPGIDGFELCRRVRSSELLCHIPVIIVTAKVTHEDRIHGFKAGADAYLEKPFQADELNIRVEQLLEQRRILQEKYLKEAGNTKECRSEACSHESEFLNRFEELVIAQIKQQQFNLSTIASEFCITKVQLNRKVKALSGINCTGYISNLRVNMAKKLLNEHKEMLVSEVAYCCGIEDVSYFISLFKKATGVTPNRFRGNQE